MNGRDAYATPVTGRPELGRLQWYPHQPLERKPGWDWPGGVSIITAAPGGRAPKCTAARATASITSQSPGSPWDRPQSEAWLPKLTPVVSFQTPPSCATGL